jgi:hypothetical protein
LLVGGAKKRFHSMSSVFDHFNVAFRRTSFARGICEFTNEAHVIAPCTDWFVAITLDLFLPTGNTCQSNLDSFGLIHGRFGHSTPTKRRQRESKREKEKEGKGGGKKKSAK